MPWLEIVSEIERDPTVLFALSGRRLEELVAGAYERQAWDDVILTRSSGDRGCGIIAVKHAICRVRIIDQCRRTLQTGAFVQNGVRALMGVPASDLNVAKGFVDTTAEFALRIHGDPTLKAFSPYGLELKDVDGLRRRLDDLARMASHRVKPADGDDRAISPQSSCLALRLTMAH